MEDYNEVIRQRIAAIEDMRGAGIDPYSGQPFEVSAFAADLAKSYAGLDAEALEAAPVPCSIAGRLVGLRSFGKAAFGHVQDSSGKIQVFFQKTALEESFALVKKLNVGDIVGASGTLFRTKTGELTVNVASFRLLTKAVRPLPEKWHGLTDVEIRYRQRYVDLIVNPEVRETFKTRSRLVRSVRDFLDAKGFMEVETPMMQPVPGGATARPFKTHHNALDIDLFLRIAPELYLKRLLVGGFERVYEINRNFRNEGISTRHNPEFTMVEFYMAYADYKGMMDLMEELITSVAQSTIGTLKFTCNGKEIDLTPPWPRIRMTDALLNAGMPEDALKDMAKAKAWAREKGIDLKGAASLGKVLDEVFSELIEPGLVNPTFVIDQPVELSPLAKRKPDEPHLTERFELFIDSRELANAFSELNDPFDQKARFVSQLDDREAGDDEAHLMDDDFVRALEYGMPPAAGAGIGIDRLAMLLTDSPSIRDVILFPQMKPEG
ncbi:MAG: lysine--tRNA ligase [Nitrospirae bacterium]|nr:lysine--tRNA ligase [Nitrospirota bacterium]